jgi:hypothetical protein
MTQYPDENVTFFNFLSTDGLRISGSSAKVLHSRALVTIKAPDRIVRGTAAWFEPFHDRTEKDSCHLGTAIGWILAVPRDESNVH